MRAAWARGLRWLGPLLLLVMLWRIGPEKCWSTLGRADPLCFFAACALTLPALALKGWRWTEIVRGLGAAINLRTSVGVYAAGMLAGAVTPGKLGDLAKAPLMAARGVPLRAGIVASLLDRALDGALLLTLGVASALALPGVPGRTAIAIAAGIAAATAAAAAMVLGKSAARAARRAGLRWWLVLPAATVAAWVPYFGSAVLCARALALPLVVPDVVAGVSVAAVLALLPVSVAGIGTRDAAFVLIFAQRGVGAEQAVALSTLILAWMGANCAVFLVMSRLCLTEIAAATGTPRSQDA